jgi:protein O-mannosyl-transferase
MRECRRPDFLAMVRVWFRMVESMSSSSSAAAAKRLDRPGGDQPGGDQPGVTAPPKLFQSPAKRTLLLCLLLAFVVLVSYNPVIHNGFLAYDDAQYITENPHVWAGLTWATVKWAFTTYDMANWHPLTWLSHALDCQVFGMNPAGHHYVNVLLQAANAILLFLLLQNATGSRWRSLMVAALFALHPINVESVAWAAERKNVLSMLFFLLALYAYAGYARRPGLGRYAAVACFFALALLSKPQAIAFPFVLLLWDYWPLCRIGAPKIADQKIADQKIGAPSVTSAAAPDGDMPRFRMGWLVLEKVPLLLLSAASAVLTMKAQKEAIQTSSQYLHWENAAISYVRYLGKALWPAKLAALYPYPTHLYPVWQVGTAVLVLVLVTAWVLRARDQRYLAVGWFWFLGNLVPMIGLVQVGSQAMADRYAYISFAGLFLMLSWLAGDWAKAHRISVRWLAVPAVSCLLALGTLTYRQVGYWHDGGSLWRHTVAVTKDNYRAQVNLGDILLDQDRIEEAGEHYRAALAILPNGPTATLGLGSYEERRGHLPAAIERYQLVARRGADVGTRATGYDRLGFAYRQMGESAKAKQCFETALQLAPDRARAMTGLGLLAQDNGDLPEAIRQYLRALAAEPTDVGYLLLAQALQQAGRLDEANAIYERVPRFSPNLAEAQKAAKQYLAGK